MIIQHNIAALNAHRQLGSNNTIVSKNLEKLSSGYRINRAGDDAAGLAISEKMRAQIKGLDRASANAQDGISLIQTAEGALTEVHSMLNRMVELSTQSANGTYKDDVDRDALQSEVESLKGEIDRISQSTNFNGINLLDGSLGATNAKNVAVDVKFASLSAKPDVLALNAATATKSEVAAGSAATLTVGNKYTLELKFQDSTGGLKNKSIEFTAANASIADATNQDVLKKAIEEAVGDEYSATVTLGAVKVEAKQEGADNKLEIFSIGVKDSVGDDVADAFGATTNTKGVDAYYTLDSAELLAYTGSDTVNAEDFIFQINGEKFAFADNDAAAKKLGADVNYVKLATSGAAPVKADVTSMIDLINEKTGIKAAANGDDKIDLKSGYLAAGKGNGLELQVGDTNDSFNKVSVAVENMSSRGLEISGIDIGTKDGAGKAQSVIKAAINKVSTNRANMGALQNRLEHTVNNLGVTSENMTAAESRIRDVDMAKEMMAFTKNNVLTQAAQAMLAQANQQSQGVLQLLR